MYSVHQIDVHCNIMVKTLPLGWDFKSVYYVHTVRTVCSNKVHSVRTVYTQPEWRGINVGYRSYVNPAPFHSTLFSVVASSVRRVSAC